MRYTTIDDLTADVIGRLGLDREDRREEIEDAIREERTSRYEDIDNAELDRIMRAVWDRVIGSEFPFPSIG
jgi:hypothetical protein